MHKSTKFLFMILFILLPLVSLRQSDAAEVGENSSDRNDLFMTVAESSELVSEAPTIVRARVVQVNWTLLADGDVNSLELNLFDDVTVVAEVSDVARGADDYIWQGMFADGTVTLSVVDNVLVGNIVTLSHRYHIRYLGGELHAIYEIDQHQFALESEPIPVETEASSNENRVPTDDGSVIDVMVVYTPQARSAAGGTSAMQALINLGMSETNTGLNNSSGNFDMNLVHMAEVSYSDTGNISLDLDRLRVSSDGYMDNVHPLRDTHHADLVSLWVANGGSACGVGYLMTTLSNDFESFAFSVTDLDCATGNYTFGHEMGHNMGSHHDPDNASGSGVFAYSHGHQAPNEAFRTIMAYNCPGGCTRVNHWSNPNVNSSGQPTGVSGVSDNALSLNNVALTVANFRDSGGGGGDDPDIDVDPASLSSTQAQNTTVTEALEISNVGDGTLNWTIEEAPSGMVTLERPMDTTTLSSGSGDIGAASKGNRLSANSAATLEPFGQMELNRGGGTTITHSNSQNVVTGNSASCNASGLHADNSYIRVFNLSDFGIGGNFNVTNVEFGVQSAAGATGSQPVTVNLYTLSGPLTFGNLTPIGSSSVNLSDQALTIANVNVAGTAPAGSMLVVEIFTPNGQTAGNSFFIGSNPNGQTASSYIAAADCGLSEPLDLAAVGFPDMHIIMNVTGTVGGGGSCSAPSNISWASVSPTSGSAAGGESDSVNVTFNSSGLGAGTYEGTLCVESNDPDESLVEVPLSLTVQPSGDPATVRVGSGMVASGGSIDVSLEALDMPVGGLGAATVDVVYDSSVVTVTGCEDDPDGVFSSSLCNINFAPNTIRLTALSTSGLSADSVLADITFSGTPGSAGDSSALDVSVETFTEPSGTPIPTIEEDGLLEIGNGGDVTCDGTSNAVDALFILQYVVGTRDAADSCPLPPGTLDESGCDVSGDSTCNTVDALFVLQCVVGTPNPFCPSGTFIPSFANSGAR